MSENFDVIVNFLIYGQFGAIQNPDSRRMSCKTYLSINSNININININSIKTESRTKEYVTQLSHYCYE